MTGNLDLARPGLRATAPSRRANDDGARGHRPRALVTGASSGIGAAFARRLADDGLDLVLSARRRERLAQLAAQLEAACSVRVTIWPADLSDAEQARELAAHVEQGPPLAMLVHSAGFGTRALLAELAPETLSAMNRLHIETPVRLVRAALPGMLGERRGRIVLLSSLAALFTTARYTTYGASKAYANHFVEGLSAELVGTGVSAQALCPGLTRTEFFDGPLHEGFRYAQAPAWAWQTPEQVVAESMASRESLCVTGRTNRLLVRLLQAPLAGRAVRAALTRANRGGLY